MFYSFALRHGKILNINRYIYVYVVQCFVNIVCGKTNSESISCEFYEMWRFNASKRGLRRRCRGHRRRRRRGHHHRRYVESYHFTNNCLFYFIHIFSFRPSVRVHDKFLFFFFFFPFFLSRVVFVCDSRLLLFGKKK